MNEEGQNDYTYFNSSAFLNFEPDFRDQYPLTVEAECPHVVNPKTAIFMQIVYDPTVFFRNNQRPLCQRDSRGVAQWRVCLRTGKFWRLGKVKFLFIVGSALWYLPLLK